jgi:hypothetical protein
MLAHRYTLGMGVLVVSVLAHPVKHSTVESAPQMDQAVVVLEHRVLVMLQVVLLQGTQQHCIQLLLTAPPPSILLPVVPV